MSNKYNRKYREKEKKLWQEILLLLPVLFALCIVPLIVLTHDYTIDFSQFDWFNTTPMTGQIDSFGYSKSVALTIAGVVSIFFFCYYLWQQTSKTNTKIKTLFASTDKKIIIILAIHLVMVILSSITSKYSDLAYCGGGYNQWQTMWVLLAYGLLFFYAYFWVTSEKQIQIILYGIIIHTVFMSFLGFMQAIDKNPLLWEFLQKIITKYSQVNGISFKTGYSSVVMTFSNPNYSGCYVALILPIVITFIFIKVSDKKWVSILCKIAGMLITAGFVKTLIGSGSTAAGMTLLGIAALTILLIFINYFNRKDKRWWIALASIIVIGIGSIFGLLQTDYAKSALDKIKNGSVDTRNLISIVNETPTRMKVNFRNGESFDLDVAVTEGNNVSFTITDSKGTNIPLSYTENAYVPTDPRFNMLSFTTTCYSMENGVCPAFILNDNPNQITFTFMYENNEWKYYTPYGKLIKLQEVEHFGFKNSENMANRRGYIWSRTIPLMKTYWFKGIGPNAFIIAFPNTDFVGSKRVGGTTLLVDKPHNTFLQTYVQTGGISAITYAALVILYIIQCVRLLWRRKYTSNLERIALGLLMSSISYMIVGLTNDAVVGVHSSYWILLGLGYAVNRMLKAKENETV
ncbi:MAG: O-antigen ligase family protein [Eubacterium sp.]